MLTLYTFGPGFGLPDPSSFVVKTQILLKMAGVAFNTDTTGFRKAPKGKIPYIGDNGQKLGDSTFIRFHLEQKYGIDFDKGLSKSEKAIAWAFEKMCEDHLYWAIIDMRWMVDQNFIKGPAMFFNSLPRPVRPLISNLVRGKFRKAGHAHGMFRHSRAEIEHLAMCDLQAISDYLGTKKYFMGDRPTGVDATIFAFVSGVLCPHFDGPIRTAAEKHANLRAYSERMMAEFFPEFVVRKKSTARRKAEAQSEATL